MTEKHDQDSAQFETMLAQQQRRRASLIKFLGLAFVIFGILALGYGLYAHFVLTTALMYVLVNLAIALACLLAGISLAIRGAKEGHRVDDLLSHAVPRIVGGKKQEALEGHKRYRRRRR